MGSWAMSRGTRTTVLLEEADEDIHIITVRIPLVDVAETTGRPAGYSDMA